MPSWCTTHSCNNHLPHRRRCGFTSTLRWWPCLGTPPSALPTNARYAQTGYTTCTHTPRARQHMSLWSAINMVVTPSYRITSINGRVDAATKEGLQQHLTGGTAPVCLCPPGRVSRPLLASSNGPARIFAGTGGGARTSALLAQMRKQLPAKLSPAPRLVYHRPAVAHRGPPHTQLADHDSGG